MPQPKVIGRIRVAAAARTPAGRSAASALLSGIEGIEIVAELDGARRGAEVPCDAVLYLLEAGESPASVVSTPPVLFVADDWSAGPADSGAGARPREWELSFVPRRCSQGELAAALTAVAAGLVVRRRGEWAPRFATRSPQVPAGREEMPGGDWGSRDGDRLTARERQVLIMIAEGHPNKMIAAELGITSHTVKFHIASIMQKLGAASRTEAVTVGVRRGIIFL